MVCDGLGGMSHGREAAILAASAFVTHLFSAPAIGWEKRLSHAIAYANSQVYRLLRGGGGTTLSAVISSNNGAMLCHVGDSRIYGVMPNRSTEQLSRDDTINAVLKRQEGEVEATKDSRLLQFVGMGEEMEAQIAVVPSEFFAVLLTSDGAHDVPHSVFQRVINGAAGGSDLVRKLLTLSDIVGGRDNASAVLLPIGTAAQQPEQIGGNELFAVFPNDTLVIHITGAAAVESTEGMHNVSPSCLPTGLSEGIEDTPALESDVGAQPAIKSTATKGRGRTTRARKTTRRPPRPKADAVDHLPFREPGNEVDVQFSVPIAQSDEDER